ncbi:Magnesium Transporter Nipa4 [Manis pentadactyla]|nr:Magnesium Transporter Nipa4 [Manis pentadactyla]
MPAQHSSKLAFRTARGREVGSESPLASWCCKPGLGGQPRQKGPEAGTPGASLPGTVTPGKLRGETVRLFVGCD